MNSVTISGKTKRVVSMREPILQFPTIFCIHECMKQYDFLRVLFPTPLFFVEHIENLLESSKKETAHAALAEIYDLIMDYSYYDEDDRGMWIQYDRNSFAEILEKLGNNYFSEKAGKDSVLRDDSWDY